MVRCVLPLFLVACGGSLSVFDDGPSLADTAASPDSTAPTGDDDAPTGDDDNAPPTDTGTLVPIADCADDVLPGPGTTNNAGNDATGSCGGGTAPEVMLSFTAPHAATWAFELSGTHHDTVLYVLDGCDGAELTCADEDEPETVGVPLDAGQEVIVVVDGAGSSQGVYDIVAREAPDSEGACANGLDDDYDGHIDCDDPDCDTKPACADEADCTDGTDNDGDGLVDCLDDNCDDDLACEASCAQGVAPSTVPTTVHGSTRNQTNDYTPSCSSNSNANDFVGSFIAPSAGTYTIDTNGSNFDTVLYVLDACQGTEVLCDDDSGSSTQSLVSGFLREGQRVIIVVDGYQSKSGTFDLNISK